MGYNYCQEIDLKKIISVTRVRDEGREKDSFLFKHYYYFFQKKKKKRSSSISFIHVCTNLIIVFAGRKKCAKGFSDIVFSSWDLKGKAV